MTEQASASSAPEVSAAAGSACDALSKDEESAPPTVSDVSGSRVSLADADTNALSSAEWLAMWQQQDAYITGIEQLCVKQEGDISSLRQQNELVRGQLSEAQMREKQFVRRLVAKEQEMQDYVCQVTELKTSQAPTATTLRATLLDPAVNGLVQLLRAELKNTKAKLEETQNDLSAWKFTPDSNTGKRLMAKCRLLYQENEELGKITSSGRIAILESDLALQKKFSEEVRQSQLELDAFLADLDEDVEGMQSTIMFLQQELRTAKEALVQSQRENAELRAAEEGSNGLHADDAPPAPPAMLADAAEDASHSQKANGDASSARADEDGDERTTRVKRVRRSSVLSIDYNDEDMCNTNGDNSMVSDTE